MEKMRTVRWGLFLALIVCLVLAASAISSASAKVCSTSGAGAACGTGHGSLYVGPLQASGTFQLEASLYLSFSCEAALSGEITNGETGTAVLTSFTFTRCTNSSGEICNVQSSASSSNKWAASFATGTPPGGTLALKNITLSWPCGFYSCAYSSAEAKMTVTGGEPATLTAISVSMDREGTGFFCEPKAYWSAKFTVTTPSSLFLT